MTPLKYFYYKKGAIIHKTFNKYFYNDGNFFEKNTQNIVNPRQRGKYNYITVLDDEGRRNTIRNARAIASTLYGPPPTPTHTTDHKDRNSTNDTPDNLRWLDQKGQIKNRCMPLTYKNAYLISKDGCDKTAKEWVDHLQGDQNPFKRDYTEKMIWHYAQRNQFGFEYKKWLSLPGETWKEIAGSRNTRGFLEISDQNRIKYVSKFAEHILSADSLGIDNAGYPMIKINNRKWLCHVIAFKTFFPDEYTKKKSGEEILHEGDDKMDFRPHKLRLGTRSDNMKDAYENGCYDGTKSARVKSVSYLNGVFEKEYASQEDCIKYLKSLGFEKASTRNINPVLKGTRKTAYGRTWKLV